jgi:hypothetical protein
MSIARQRLDKYVPVATDTYATMWQLLEILGSVVISRFQAMNSEYKQTRKGWSVD